MPEVHVYMAEGRSDEQKRAMMLDVTNALVKHLECPPDVVTIQIIEARWTDKMKGGRTFAERYSDRAPSGYHAAASDRPAEADGST